MKFSFAAISLFLATAGLFCYLAVHHQHRRVILKVIQDPWSHASPLLRNSQVGFHHFLRSGPPRYVTVVMPSVVNPKKRTRRLESIADTWGPLANAVYVVHNVSEFPQSSHQVYYKEQHPADPYAYPQLLLVPPHITVSDGLPRLNYVIRSIFEKINPDFAFFVNDHTYVIPEHICRFLHKRDPTVSIYAGHALKNHKEAFNSGAAGYFLSRKSMSLLVKSWDEERDDCVVKDDNKWLQGNPGIVTARCLHHQLETPALDTREKGKWHRFHAFGIVGVVKGKVDGWYLNKHEDLENILGFDPSYSKLLEGEGCCSKETISFHYVEFKETRALFSVRQALLKNPQMTDQQLQDLMMQEWPTEWNELGGYSKPLPKKESTDEWKPLLAVVRKISSRHTQMDC
mmetsp:Transcript_15957/g.27023  ORF Transcript_15957/g.27023 Transcript_15957/m.27023 type:complete len:400 (-) Transcript_15957:407-1606(-)